MTDVVPSLVSTIIPVHNRPEMIKSAVESVLSQEYQSIEVIIVDDGSTDETLQICNELAKETDGVITVLSQVNLGPGPARERGRLKARGEFIQYLDSDDLLMPGKFREQVKLLRQKPDCGIAYGVTRLADFNGNILAEPFKWTGEKITHLFPGLLVDRWWCTHTPLYRRSVCDQIGPWSDLRYSQDWEYDARAASLGLILASTDSLVSEHRTHEETRQTGHGKWLQPKGQVRFFNTLYECALKAGVDKSTPEMSHFSRWVFFYARKSGLEGEAAHAAKLFKLACDASGGKDGKLAAYSIASRLLGWKTAGRLGKLHDRITGGKAGHFSMKQSWMSED